MSKSHALFIYWLLLGFFSQSLWAAQQFFCEVVASPAPRSRKATLAPSAFDLSVGANQLRREIFATLLQASHLMTTPLELGHLANVQVSSSFVTATLVGPRRSLAFDFAKSDSSTHGMQFQKSLGARVASVAPTILPANLTLFPAVSIAMKVHYDDGNLERTGAYLAVYDNATGEVRYVFENRRKEIWLAKDFVLAPALRGDHLFFSADFPETTAAGGVDRIDTVTGEVLHLSAPEHLGFTRATKFAVHPLGQHILWLQFSDDGRSGIVTSTRIEDGHQSILSSELSFDAEEAGQSDFTFDAQGNLWFSKHHWTWLEVSKKF